MAETQLADRRRPELTAQDNVLAVVFGFWTIVGLFLDGWAHDNGKPESFFTPWHGILYSGFGAAAVAALWVVMRNRVPSRPWREAIPAGHGVTLMALGAFAIGAVGDLTWHEVLGIEVGVEALLSPTHLLLMVGGLVALTDPVRRAWRQPDGRPETLKSFLPVVLSAALALAVVGFFLAYLSPFVNDAAGASFERGPDVPHDHPATDPDELLQMLGIASILTTTVLVAVVVAALRRRWRTPDGTFTVLMGVTFLLFVGLDELRQAPMVLAGLAAGAVMDRLRHRPTWLVVPAGTTVLWLGYFGIYRLLEGGIGWSAELWSGTIVLSAVLAASIAAAASVRTPAVQTPVLDDVAVPA